MYDVVLLTDHRYLKEVYPDEYSNNVITEDTLVKKALEKRGLRVYRTNWDNPDFDWSATRTILFRTTWDYFNRYAEFSNWLEDVSTKTSVINPAKMIRWNVDKHYLLDLQKKGVAIVPTYFIEPGDNRSLKDCVKDAGWDNAILKPAISGAARHTYKLNPNNLPEHESIFTKLIAEESMLIQPFLANILSKGEVAHMVMGGKYTHSVLKLAKPGDFRVQDDFGGTIHDYQPNSEEIKFVEFVMSKLDPVPAYGRVDVIWDDSNKLVVSELELIEPELWFRRNHHAVEILAQTVFDYFTEMDSGN